VIFPQDEAERICAAARERGIATFLDGARLWNAAAATGIALDALARRSTWSPCRFPRAWAHPAGRFSPGAAT
jgi:threonine aldolase